MGSVISDFLLSKKHLSDSPVHARNVHYEVVVGSNSYGVSQDSSDLDILAFSIPEKHIVFPKGIPGFGHPPVSFNSYQKHGIVSGDTNYDFSIYNIVKYFQLCMDCSPNMIDSLFVPDSCVLYLSSIGRKVRENRDLFLSKKIYHTFKGYAYKQRHLLRTKNPIGSRNSIINKYGFDVKFAYHIVRLLLELEEVLMSGTLTLDKNKDILSDIRGGLWSVGRIEDFLEEKIKEIDFLYSSSSLPDYPREKEIECLLFECLTEEYGVI